MRRTMGAMLMAGTLALVGGLGFGATDAKADGFGPRGGYGHGGYGHGGYGHGGYGRGGYGHGGWNHGPGRHFCSHHRRWDCSCRPMPLPPPPPSCGPRFPRPYPSYGFGPAPSYSERVYESRTVRSYAAPLPRPFPY